jgi:hypothetical protein
VPAENPWGWRNCGTPGRFHEVNTSSAVPVAGTTSCSMTATCQPRRAKPTAVASPATLPPITTARLRIMNPRHPPDTGIIARLHLEREG